MYAYQNKKIKQRFIPRYPGFDRRVKLTEQDRDVIRRLYYEIGGWSQRRLARQYGVSRRLVQFILDEKKLLRQKALYAQRRKDGRYYIRSKHTLATAKHRHHKSDLHKNGLLSEKKSI